MTSFCWASIYHRQTGTFWDCLFACKLLSRTRLVRAYFLANSTSLCWSSLFVVNNIHELLGLILALLSSISMLSLGQTQKKKLISCFYGPSFFLLDKVERHKRGRAKKLQGLILRPRISRYLRRTKLYGGQGPIARCRTNGYACMLESIRTSCMHVDWGRSSQT